MISSNPFLNSKAKGTVPFARNLATRAEQTDTTLALTLAVTVTISESGANLARVAGVSELGCNE